MLHCRECSQNKNQIMKLSKSGTTFLLKENTELPVAKNLTKPSRPTEPPNCRKHFEVRRCRVSVLNMQMDSREYP